MEIPFEGEQPPFFQLRDAVVRRDGREILNVPSFILNEGESMALLGPNGAGKSTFIKLITREMLPLHRDIPPMLFRGQDRAVLTEVRASLGIVSPSMQDQITVHLTALEVVMGGLFGTLGTPSSLGLSIRDEDQQRAMLALEEAGIAHLASRDIKTLSSGQARRVLIARALVGDPSALVLDEPCSGLDPQGMFYVRRLMRQLVQRGHAIILVTHYPEDIVPEIDRLLLIKEGTVFADGTKRELLTDQSMSMLFDVPLQVRSEHGYYSLRSDY